MPALGARWPRRGSAAPPLAGFKRSRPEPPPLWGAKSAAQPVCYIRHHPSPSMMCIFVRLPLKNLTEIQISTAFVGSVVVARGRESRENRSERLQPEVVHASSSLAPEPMVFASFLRVTGARRQAARRDRGGGGNASVVRLCGSGPMAAARPRRGRRAPSAGTTQLSGLRRSLPRCRGHWRAQASRQAR